MVGSPNPVTDEEKAEIRRLHGEGKSCRAIADEIDRSPTTVSEKAAEMGLSFDRSQTEAATKAALKDNAAKRAAIIAWQYDRTLRLAARLDADTFKVAGQTQFGMQAEELDFVPDGSELNLSRAIGTYLKAAADLEKVDATDGTDAARGMLGDLMARLRGPAKE
jgi:hypothetical protein